MSKDIDILVVPLASKIHGENYYRPLYEIFVKHLSQFHGVRFYEKIVTSEGDIDIRSYRADLLVLIHLTGGTSSLAKNIGINAGTPIVLVAHSRHNSLASSLSAKAWLEKQNVRVKLLYVDTPDSLPHLFRPLYEGIRAAKTINNLRVLEINESGITSQDARRFIEATGAYVETISYSDLMNYVDKIEDTTVPHLTHLDTSGVKQEELIKAIKIYYALKKLLSEKNCNALSIDCFPFNMRYHVTPCLALALLNSEGIPAACENDFYSLLSLAISINITGKPGWMANPSGIVDEKYLRFAHCTIATSLCTRAFLVPHFETGFPHAVACSLNQERMLTLRFDLDYKELHVYDARIVRSGLLEPGFCRTQIICEFKGIKPIEFLEKAKGNHHVFIPYVDGIEEKLKILSWFMGWNFVFHK